LAAAGGDAAVEGDVEGAQGGCPAVGPAGASLAGGVEAADGQVQHFQRRLLGGEMASGVDRTAEPRVDGLDGVGTRYERAWRPAHTMRRISTSKPRNGTISAHALVHNLPRPASAARQRGSAWSWSGAGPRARSSS